MHKAKGPALSSAFDAAMSSWLSSFWMGWILPAGGLVSPEALWPSVSDWRIGNMIVRVVVGPIFLGALTLFIERCRPTAHGVTVSQQRSEPRVGPLLSSNLIQSLPDGGYEPYLQSA
jgi:hypothetical protein